MLGVCLGENASFTAVEFQNNTLGLGIDFLHLKFVWRAEAKAWLFLLGLGIFARSMPSVLRQTRASDQSEPIKTNYSPEQPIRFSSFNYVTMP